MADGLALTLAKKLNDGDRIGQINNIVVRSRELVYLSRQSQHLADATDDRVYRALSALLLDDARNNARVVDKEYSTISSDIEQDSQLFIKSVTKSFDTASPVQLPWLIAKAPRIHKITLGYMKDMKSNVYANTSVACLFQSDCKQGFVDSGANLFAANREIPLPAPDDDLRFRIGSLPAPVESTVNECRLIEPSRFVSLVTVFPQKSAGQFDFLPSAASFAQKVTVTHGKLQSDLVTGATAITTGAQPVP